MYGDPAAGPSRLVRPVFRPRLRARAAAAWLETQAEALCKYLRTKPDPPERIEEPEEDEDEDEDAEQRGRTSVARPCRGGARVLFR